MVAEMLTEDHCRWSGDSGKAPGKARLKHCEGCCVDKTEDAAVILREHGGCPVRMARR